MKAISCAELKSIRAGAQNFGEAVSAIQHGLPDHTWSDMIHAFHDQGNNVGKDISYYARNASELVIIVE